MIAKEKLIRALENLQEIEHTARKLYREPFGKLEDREMRSFVAWLIKAEEKHRAMIEEALELIGEEGKDI